MFTYRQIFYVVSCVALAVAISACGGGSSTSAASAPANEGVGNQLAPSIAIAGYSSVSLAKVTPTASSTQTASLSGVLNWVAGKIFPSAYAQAATQCNYDLLKLAGVGADGTLEQLAVTTVADDCASGFIDMYDGKRYLLLTASGIYKDGLTCNLVLINKTSGTMYCVGEKSRSIYSIAGQSDWKAYEKLQVSDSGNYLYLEADSTVYDMNGQVTGKKTKLIRFDLTDDALGPVTSTVVEGFQKSWLTDMYGSNGNSEYEGFSIRGFQALNGGDLAMLYERWVSTGSSWASKLNGHYYTFDSAGEYTRVPFDGSAIGTAVNNANIAKTQSYNSAIGNLDTAYWYNISCFFKDETDANSFIFTVPYYWYNSAGGQYTNGTSSVIFRGSKPSAEQTTMPVTMLTGDSAICADSGYYMPGQSNTSLRPSKIGDTYYALQQVTGNFNNQWGTQLSLVGNKFDGNADTVQLVSQSQNWWGSNKLYGTKTRLLLQLPPDWSGVAPDAVQPGDRIWSIDPSSTFSYTTVNGAAEIDSSTYTELIASDEHIAISKLTASPLREEFSFTGRDLSDEDLKKLIVEVDGNGVVTKKDGVTSTLEAVSIIKL